MQVQFYHLISTGFERALPPLAQKALQGGYRLCVKMESKDAIKKLDDWLWSYDADSFLPHGIEGSDHLAEHPIYLTTQFDRPNKANIIITTDGSFFEHETEEGVERVLDLFDGNDETCVQAARDRWRRYKEAGAEITYWQQQAGGGWKKAA
ncbi:MAG: DNA polymerase III subunit chi [Rickettsiales bacterium]|nr:DNA polymerase III subunit chi [Rickettsiales bacterium]